MNSPEQSSQPVNEPDEISITEEVEHFLTTEYIAWINNHPNSYYKHVSILEYSKKPSEEIKYIGHLSEGQSFTLVDSLPRTSNSERTFTLGKPQKGRAGRVVAAIDTDRRLATFFPEFLVLVTVNHLLSDDSVEAS